MNGSLSAVGEMITRWLTHPMVSSLLLTLGLLGL